MCETEGRFHWEFDSSTSFFFSKKYGAQKEALVKRAFVFMQKRGLPAPQLLSGAFVLVPTSPLFPFFFALFLLQPHSSLFHLCLL